MRSVLDDLGQEVTGIAAPVSICMALTVALVRILNPDGASNSGSVYLASIYYSEQVSTRGAAPRTLPELAGRAAGCWMVHTSRPAAPRRHHTTAPAPPRRLAGRRLRRPETQRFRHQRAHIRGHHRAHDLCAGLVVQIRGEHKLPLLSLPRAFPLRACAWPAMN